MTVADASFPPLDLDSFLRDYVWSYEELKAVICLGTRRDVWWSIAAVASDCKVDVDAVVFALNRLSQLGLFAVRGAPEALEFSLHENFHTRAEFFDQLAVEYREDPLRLIELMTRNSFDRVRTSALKTFADCFRIRKPKEDQ